MFYQWEHIGTADYFKKEQGENFNYPLHLHRSFELILVDEGTMTVTADGVRYLLKQGEGALIFPDQIHSLESEASRHTLFIFSPRIVQAFFTEKNGHLPKSNRVALSEDSLRALHSLTAESSKYELKGAMYTVCAAFDRQTAYKDVEGSKQELLFRILSYTEQNFKGNCELNTLAAAIGYNPEYVSRFFKKKMGIPYHRYLNTRRLNHAAYLLQNNDETCLACAIESGYTSLRSFNRNFKSFFGVTPQDYRKLHLP